MESVSQSSARHYLYLFIVSAFALSGCFSGELELIAESAESAAQGSGSSTGGSTTGGGESPLSIGSSMNCIMTSAYTDVSVSGGVPPYLFSLDAGSTGTINASTGRVTGNAVSGVALVRVTDSLGETAMTNISIAYPLSLNPSSAVVDAGEVQNFVAQNGCNGLALASMNTGEGSIQNMTSTGFDFSAPESPSDLAPATSVWLQDGMGYSSYAYPIVRSWRNQVNQPAGGVASANAVAFDYLGNVYVVGNSIETYQGTQEWIVRKSSDNGETWNTIGTYQRSAGSASKATAVASFSNYLYVAGSGIESSISRWLVRRWDGSSWVDSDAITGYPSEATTMAVTNGGTVYVAGTAQITNNRWMVRRSIDSGVSWTASDTGFVLSSLDARPEAMTTDPITLNVYITGWALDSQSLRKWIVREYNGSTWSTIFDLAPGGFNSAGYAIAVNTSESQLYIGGITTDAGGVPHWSIRSRPLAGGTWTEEVLPSDGGAPSAIGALTSDSAGHMYAAADLGSSGKWVVLKKNAYTGTWKSIGEYSVSITYPSTPFAIVSHPWLDQIWSVGKAMTSASTAAWAVRILKSN